MENVDDWKTGRAEAQTVEEKEKYNVWDKFSDFADVVAKANTGEWLWGLNTRCKYVELRVDMRSGHCIIRDRDGVRINPDDLAKQA
jgi:hypothetical protein